MNRDRIDYVLGAEVGITELLTAREVIPFLEQVLVSGLRGVQVRDNRERVLWEIGSQNDDEIHVARLFLEGESVGSLRCAGHDGAPRLVGGVLAGAFNFMLFGSLKRKLTTEVHTHAINQSYDELVESEQRYRELAASLEVRVEERTRELKQVYNRLLQQEKLASVGQLAAGIAHEINNPMGFILSNFSALEKYVGRFRTMLLFCREQLAAGAPEGFPEEFAARWSQQKFDLMLDDADALIQQSREGGERVKKIVSDLRGFSHIDRHDHEPVDINEELARTLSVMAHEMPADARIIRDFEPLPEFPGNPALLCQAFFNLIRNAFQCRPLGLVLTLSTRYRGGTISVVFADNGPGIEEALQTRIFEPFFTTREVGRGMGLGLALVYDIVTNAGGIIAVDSRPGEGSRFTLELPCRREDHGQVR